MISTVSNVIVLTEQTCQGSEVPFSDMVQFKKHAGGRRDRPATYVV